VTRAEKARRIAKILDRLHPDSDVPLDHVDPYTLLGRGDPLRAVHRRAREPGDARAVRARFDARRDGEALRLGDRAHDPLVRARPGEGEGDPLAFRRSCAISIGGRVPADIDALEALPGVGHKTASVVMVQAFGVPAFPVDTHIHRLAGRWGLSRAKNVAMVERDLKALVPARGLGEGAPPDHPVRPRALSRARPRPARVPDLLVGGVEGADRPRDGATRARS
jgi:endonuclease-3